jgi:DNA-binding SARP family transcriptional activator
MLAGPASARRAARIRLLQLIASGVLGATVAVMRPVLPQFGPSLATPLTTSTLTRLAMLLLWLVCLVLALVLLHRALFPPCSARPTAWPVGVPASKRRRRPPSLRREAPPAPRLIVQPRSQATSPAVRDRPVVTEDEVDQPSSVASIALLGPAVIDGIRRPRRATTIELLAYLALHREGALRDHLLEAMWPGEDPRRTRSRLWQSVSEARRLLGDAFERDGDRYILDRTRVDVDIDALEGLVARLEHASPADAAPLAEQALRLWRGNPLEGTDYAWADGDIRQLEATLSKLAVAAARVRLEARDAHGALGVAEQGLRFDDLNETFVRLAFEAEAALGRRESMTERYDALREQLDLRLGLEPERATRVLYRRLLGQG